MLNVAGNYTVGCTQNAAEADGNVLLAFGKYLDIIHLSLSGCHITLNTNILLVMVMVKTHITFQWHQLIDTNYLVLYYIIYIECMFNLIRLAIGSKLPHDHHRTKMRQMSSVNCEGLLVNWWSMILPSVLLFSLFGSVQVDHSLDLVSFGSIYFFPQVPFRPSHLKNVFINIGFG